MRTVLSVCFCLAFIACGGGGTPKSHPDLSNVPNDFSLISIDQASSSKDMSGGQDLLQHVTTDLAACMPPTGNTCPTTAGNCLGIGAPCTQGGGQCATYHLFCDKDLDPTDGSGICVSYLACTPNMGQCGKGATCCKTTTTQNIPVCFPNACIPADCTAEP